MSKMTRFWSIALGLALVAGFAAYRRALPRQLGFHEPVVEAQGSGSISGPHIGGCPVFPADNIWNTPVDTLKKHPRSNAYIQSIGALKKVHPDFGGSLVSGIPFTEVPAGTVPVAVDFENKEETDLGKYPIPKDAPVEGGGGHEGDRHVILIDSRQCVLYELFSAELTGKGWTAYAGIRMDLKSNALRRDGYTSADAAGLPIFPGLVRYDEVAAGRIEHALRFTIPKTQKAHLWPARHQASGNTDENLTPMGARFRLRADFDISKYSFSNRVIMKALKRYGMFMADNGGAMYLSGVSDRRWSDSDLHELGAMKAEDFEVVDESDLQTAPDSAKVDAAALKP